MLNNQNIILNTAREIKSFVGEVHSKAESILNHQARAPTAQVCTIYLLRRFNISWNFYFDKQNVEGAADGIRLSVVYVGDARRT